MIARVSARSFLALSSAEKALLVLAWRWLFVMRTAIWLTSFKSLTRNLEHNRNPVKLRPLTQAEALRAVLVGQAVARAARYTPWKSTCLIQVLATQRLLAKEGIPGQFYLGVIFGAKANIDQEPLSAHAWLESGDRVVNGESGDCFIPVSTFSWY